MIIGDMPPNTEHDFEEKRKDTCYGYGIDYWNSAYPDLVPHSKYVTQLADAKVPIHTVMMTSSCEAEFKKMSD
jgi:phenylalanine-4-hydroxylase